jgi:tetratricopeptide (TPR) repeat protein
MVAPRSLILSLLLLTLTMLPARAGDAELCGRSAADPDAGIPACTRLLDHPSREADVPVLYNSRGVAKLVKGDFDSAVEDFTRALDRRPRYVDAFKNRGRARQEQGDYDKAIADFNQALQLNAKSPDLYNARGSALFNKGEYDRAIADFTKAFSLDPKYKDAFVNRGLAYLHTRRITQAIADFDVVVSIAPNEPRGYVDRAMARMDKADFNGAIADYNEAIRLDPKNSGSYTRRGEAWRLQGDFKRSLADHDKAIDLNPTQGEAYEAYNNRALVFKDQGKLDKAIADCDEAILLNPTFFLAYANRGLTRRLKGDLSGSLMDLDKAVKLNPRSPISLTFRGDTSRESGDDDRAMKDFSEAIRILPDFVAAYTGRGLTYEKKGDWAKAKADFEKALSLSADLDSGLARPAQDVARTHLASLLTPPTGTDPAKLVLTFDSEIPPALSLPPGSQIRLNNHTFKIEKVDAGAQTVTLLGKEENGPRRGLNLFGTLTYWYENERLKAFQDPYGSSSYAIIAAVDDYNRYNDPLKREKTGYPPLKHMVENAQRLYDVLIGLGFPADHIRTFYNQAATQQNLNAALSDFWEGGRFEGASRLFFYFGGHGDGREGNGFLVTYDFDPKRPTITGFLMRDFAGRHFPLIKAHHFLVAIDSCSAGLALPGMRTLGEGPTRSLVTLAEIRADVKEPARNLLVAGTGASLAIADPNSGGIFTDVLIEGLKGNADLYKSGVIPFGDLLRYVRHEVIGRTAAMGVEQVPSGFSATDYGHGEVVFQLPQPK